MTFQTSLLARLGALLTLLGCAAPTQPSAGPAYANWPDPFETMARGPAQTAAVCARAKDHVVREVFCSGAAPSFTSLVELQTALGVDAAQAKEVTQIALPSFVNISVTGHSTALATRSVSAINPRVIAMRIDGLRPVHYVTAAFARGEQFVELAVNDRTDNSLQLYVVSFQNACNRQPDGCSTADLLTPAVETGWTETTLYDEEDFKNTVMDCLPCHQPGGPGTTKFLRMQEYDAPWTHWFSPNSEGGRALFADFVAAHGDEPYAGYPAALLEKADPLTISTLVTLSIGTQPNVFHSAAIENEVKMSSAALGGNQPFDNSIPGQSSTWRLAYDEALRGRAIAFPYHNVKVTDPVKLANMTSAYQSFQREDGALPDIRAVFPDDPAALAHMGLSTEPGLDGRGVLLQSCSQCHNPTLDQTLTRARFRADLVGVDRATKDEAIMRLSLPPDDPRAMPPARLRVLSDEARQLAIGALRQ
jgi:hypothetical protein